jgi:hypothetical protein
LPPRHPRLRSWRLRRRLGSRHWRRRLGSRRSRQHRTISLRRWCLQLQRHISLTDHLPRDEAFDDYLVPHWQLPDKGIGHAWTTGDQLKGRHWITGKELQRYGVNVNTTDATDATTGATALLLPAQITQPLHDPIRYETRSTFWRSGFAAHYPLCTNPHLTLLPMHYTTPHP